jgi:MFS family permease
MNASSTGVATIIPIYILALGGQVREVAIAAFLSNLAITLGAVFWGRLIDVLHWRRRIIAISSIAIAIVGASMYFVSSIPALMMISALVGFFSVGPAPVTNLLVMESSAKEDRLKTFSWTSLVSGVGFVIAMLAGYLWLMQYDSRSYSLVCAAIAITSLALTMMFVRDPPLKLERRSLVSSPALVYRLRHIPVMFLKPRADMSLTRVRQCISKRQFLFFAGTGLFFLSGSMMFTPYTPFLKDSGVSDSEVFLAYTLLYVSKVFFVPLNHKIVAKGGEAAMNRIAYVPRIFGLGLAVAAAVIVTGSPGSILMITIFAFVAAEVGFTIWSTTSTLSLLRIIPAAREGSILGVYSAIIGAGILIGSIAAGETVVTFGYAATFAIAIGFAAASFVLVSRFFIKTATVATSIV